MTDDRAMTEVVEAVLRVEDDGMTYEVIKYHLINSEHNVARGGKPVIYDLIKVFKVKKNGQRGMQLMNMRSRLQEVIRNTK